MRWEGWGGLGVALVLASCASAPERVVVSPRIVCPAVLVAEPAAEPAPVPMTDALRLAADVAAIRALGAPIASADAEQRLQHEAWGRNGWSRVTAGRAWCAELDKRAEAVSDNPR